ncbi:MAG: hypothetical protein ACLPSW_29220 [Roseiarcus sp.]
MDSESRQQRRARERREKTQRENEQLARLANNETGKASEPLIRSWPITLGVPLGTYGAGLAVLSFHFWLGVWIAYLAALWLLIDWLFVSQKEKWPIRAVLALIPLAGAALVSWLAFRPAELEVSAFATDDVYNDGTVIAGIKWKNFYSNLRIVFDNKQNDQYTNLEAVIRTTLSIAKVGSLNAFSQCQSAIDTPGVEIAGATLTLLGTNGKPEESIPLFTPDSPNVFATQFKFVCDRILPNNHLEAVVAVSPGPAVTQRKKPSWVSIAVKYDAYGRTHSETKQYCFEPPCSIIPPQGR